MNILKNYCFLFVADIRKLITFLSLGILLSTILFGCKENKFKVDLESSKVEIKIKRLDKALFSGPPENTMDSIEQIQKSFDPFFTLFTSNVIGVGAPSDPNFKNTFRSFLEDQTIRTVSTEILDKFNDVSELESGLSEAFSYYKYYFPNKPIPAVITYNSGFHYAIITDETQLAIGLEMYLGRNTKYYELLGFPKYRTSRMEEKNILPDAVKGWVSTEFDQTMMKNDLLSQIIINGKNLYLLDALLPEVEDSVKIGFSEQQLEWCKNSDDNIWKHLIAKDLLYTTDQLEIIKYVGEAPFTSGFPRESPGQTGVWLGWMIVRSYMEHNKVSLPELMAEKDAQKILTLSKYKPSK